MKRKISINKTSYGVRISIGSALSWVLNYHDNLKLPGLFLMLLYDTSKVFPGKAETFEKLLARTNK